MDWLVQEQLKMTRDWRGMTSNVSQAQREWLVAAARATSLRFKKPVFVNIGIGRGCSMYCLRAGCTHARLIGIDNRDCRAKYHLGLDAEFVIGDSGYCHSDFDVEIHLLFIDGDHSLGGVTRDIEGWTPKITPGGCVAFHDYFMPQPRWCVEPAVQRWLERNGDLWQDIAAADWMRALQRKTAIECLNGKG